LRLQKTTIPFRLSKGLWSEASQPAHPTSLKENCHTTPSFSDEAGSRTTSAEKLELETQNAGLVTGILRLKEKNTVLQEEMIGLEERYALLLEEIALVMGKNTVLKENIRVKEESQAAVEAVGEIRRVIGLLGLRMRSLMLW
jgi:hypothetical protein